MSRCDSSFRALVPIAELSKDCHFSPRTCGSRQPYETRTCGLRRDDRALPVRLYCDCNHRRLDVGGYGPSLASARPLALGQEPKAAGTGFSAINAGPLPLARVDPVSSDSVRGWKPSCEADRSRRPLRFAADAFRNAVANCEMDSGVGLLLG